MLLVKKKNGKLNSITISDKYPLPLISNQITRLREANYFTDLERLKTVLKVLTKSGFISVLNKCSFLKSTVQYLGNEFRAGEIRPNVLKIALLSSFPPPQTVTGVR